MGCGSFLGSGFFSGRLLSSGLLGRSLLRRGFLGGSGRIAGGCLVARSLDGRRLLGGGFLGGCLFGRGLFIPIGHGIDDLIEQAFLFAIFLFSHLIPPL